MNLSLLVRSLCQNADYDVALGDRILGSGSCDNYARRRRARVLDTQTQVVNPDTTRVATPMLRRIVSSGVFASPPKPFLTTRCSPSRGVIIL
jgi:hypothetical protein